ncbi:hypothetical protein B0H16DRAFT_1883179 [Mycena metata]|uniref:Uncharacterized protein n=1 Tax=Mycena metata TaxID=1033252 RepID=A0AAD7NLE7_9AGAR|nr:hypothetical protein B0H16DRAFT_1883179 [Mycena metata]
MAILDWIADAARRAWDPENPTSIEEIHWELEWSWGLEYGTLKDHLEGINSDRQMADILADANLIVVAAPETIGKMSLHLSQSPMTDSSTYEDTRFARCMGPAPLNTLSSRLTLQAESFHGCSFLASLLTLRWLPRSTTFSSAGATRNVPSMLRSSPSSDMLQRTPRLEPPSNPPRIHSWACGLYTNDGRGFMFRHAFMIPKLRPTRRIARREAVLWRGNTPHATLASEDEEPQRRLLPHELKVDFNEALRAAADEGDDAISCDSYITGLEGKPEEFSKTSMARAKYDEEDAAWEQGIKSWAQGASVVDDERMLLNDDQIEEDPEQPRVATTLDLKKPDYLARHGKVR